MDRRRGAVDRYLDAFDAERNQPIRCEGIDPTAVRFQLQGDAAPGQDLEELPAVGHLEGFATAKRAIGDARRDDPPRELERFVPIELVNPGLIGTRLLAARDAASGAAIGKLPSDERGARYASTERPAMMGWVMSQVNRM